MQTCNRCGETRPYEDYRNRPDRKWRLKTCKPCESKIQAVYYRIAKERDPIAMRVRSIRFNRSKAITLEWLLATLEAQGYCCAISGRPIDLMSLEVDHITPRAKGGRNGLANLQLVDRNANAAKGALTSDELVALCVDIIRTLRPEIIGRAILSQTDGGACNG